MRKEEEMLLIRHNELVQSIKEEYEKRYDAGREDYVCMFICAVSFLIGFVYSLIETGVTSTALLEFTCILLFMCYKSEIDKRIGREYFIIEGMSKDLARETERANRNSQRQQ